MSASSSARQSAAPPPLLLLASFAGLAWLSALPFFARHPMGEPAGPLVYLLLLSFLLYAAAVAPRLERLAGSRLLAAAGVALLALGNLLLFPGTRLVARPSSAPDALAQPVARLLAGLEPYGERLFDGAPISPGPGWILLHGPFTALGLGPLILPAWLALAAWLLARAGGRPAGFVALTMAPLAFLQMSVVGHDIFAISLAFLVVLLAARQAPARGPAFLALAILAGTVATARLPLIILLPVLGLGLAAERGRAFGWRFAAIAIATCLVWHAAAFLWCWEAGDFYQPLHVFARADNGAGRWFSLAGALCGLAAAAWIWRRRDGGTRHTLLGLWLLQTALFLPIGLGELVNLQPFGWADWEGKNYLAYPLPLLAAALLLPSQKRVWL
jgi:hypothetical protein